MLFVSFLLLMFLSLFLRFYGYKKSTQNCDISPIGTLHSSGVVMFINQETNNKIARARTKRPLRVSLPDLVAFAICRLLSVVVVTPTPITFCYECV
jgi:hypothetical protein